MRLDSFRVSGVSAAPKSFRICSGFSFPNKSTKNGIQILGSEIIIIIIKFYFILLIVLPNAFTSLDEPDERLLEDLKA